ncbi:MAG: hypothetical protein SPG27_15555 [Butyricimonas virosa]|nr:hypothetical protein [Butyricimonas virosa]
MIYYIGLNGDAKMFAHNFNNQRVIIFVYSSGKIFVEADNGCVIKEYIDSGYFNKFVNYLENPLKVVPLIHSNLTPVKFSHSPFCLFLFSSYSSCPLCRVLH